jgi:hypothetical protein
MRSSIQLGGVCSAGLNGLQVVDQDVHLTLHSEVLKDVSSRHGIKFSEALGH